MQSFSDTDFEPTFSRDNLNLFGSSRNFDRFLPSFLSITCIEPDPPKKFNVTFINITSVVISWWAYLCNEALPRELRVRYRQQGSAVWTVTKYKYPSGKMVLRRQFKYKTEYEFKVSIAYNGLRSRYSSVVKIRSPGMAIFYL